MLSGTCPEKRTIEDTSFKLWIFTNLWMRNSKTQPSSLQYQYFLLQVCSIFDNFVKLCNFRQAKKNRKQRQQNRETCFPKGIIGGPFKLISFKPISIFFIQFEQKNVYL